jgi:hypothetical protein
VIDFSNLDTLTIEGKAVESLTLDGDLLWEATKSMTVDDDGVLSLSGKAFTVDAGGIIDLRRAKL